MSGTVFFILYRFKTINTFFTGIVGGLFLGMIFAISISAISNWNSFYMMSFVMGFAAFISLCASFKANESDIIVETYRKENKEHFDKQKISSYD